MGHKAPQKDFPHLNREERRHVGTLLERRDYLAQRMTEVPKGPATYHEAEHAALNWVLHLVQHELEETES